MKKKLTLKDCTKENFEKSWKMLEDAEKAYKEKDIELGKRWSDSGYDNNIYYENKKILQEYQDAFNEAYKNIVPYVGLKCSIKAYTDNYACVITKVITPTQVEVTHLKYDILDFYGCKYKVSDEIIEGTAEVFSKRKNGVWATYGVAMKNYPCKLRLNSTYHHIDPCF